MRVPGFALWPVLRKSLAVYFSAGLLLGGLGVGIARGDEKDKPVYIGVLPAQQFSLASPSQSGFSLAMAAQSSTLDSFVMNTTYDAASVKPNEPAYTAVNKTEQAKAAEAKQPEKKKNNTILYILGGIAVAVGGYFIYKALTKKKPIPTPTPTPDYKETTKTLNVKNVLTSQTLSGILIEYDDIDANSNRVHETYTTDSGGNATISYKEGTQPNLTVSGANFVTRSTYVKWLSNDIVTLMPTSFDTTTFDIVARESERSGATHVTKRWTKQPTYVIVTKDMDDVTKGYIYDVLQTNEIKQLTGAKIIGTTTPTEVPSKIELPENHQIVFEFRDDFTTDSNASTFVNYDTTTFEIIGVLIKLNINKRPNIRRQTILHEIGHGVGHAGHGTKHNMLMGDAAHYVGYVTQWDIDNGTVMYSRPCGNAAPDNDPAEGGAIDSSVSAAVTALSPTSMTGMFTATTLPGKEGLSVGSFKLPGKQSGRATLHDIVAMLPDVQVREGKFGLALNPAQGQVQAGFGDDKAGVATTITNNGYSPADFTAAAQLKEGAFTGGAQYSTLTGNLQAGASIAAAKGIEVMVFDAYDTKRQANTFNLGTSLFDRKVNVSYGFQTASNLNVHVLNAQTQFGLGEVLVNASGSVTKYSADDINMALNVSARFGRAMVLGSYSREQLGRESRDYARFSLLLPVGPGLLDGSFLMMPGMKPDPCLAYTVRIAM